MYTSALIESNELEIDEQSINDENEVSVVISKDDNIYKCDENPDILETVERFVFDVGTLAATWARTFTNYTSRNTERSS